PKQTKTSKKRVPAPDVAENGQILIELDYLLFSGAMTEERCVPYHTKYAPARKFYAVLAEDYVHFTQQIKANLGCKVAIKLIMTNPELVAKDTAQETIQNHYLTLDYGDVKAKAAVPFSPTITSLVEGSKPMALHLGVSS
ncbi:hypothetical protein MJO28_012512, partial [Puccinia striiformis f. sp. tritici]